MTKFWIILGGLLIIATTVLVKLIFTTGKEGDPGFLGPGVFIADVNLVLEVVLVLGLTAGMFMAKAGNIKAHRINQTTWVLVNAVLVALVMWPSMEDVRLDKLADLSTARVGMAWLHAAVGTLTIASGIWLVLQMNNVLPRMFHIPWWKSLMRATLVGYWLTALLGLATYMYWYGK